jgi:hypothetical protein
MVMGGHNAMFLTLQTSYLGKVQVESVQVRNKFT